MKLSKVLYIGISILFFCTLLLVNLDFAIIYQKNIAIPYQLDETSVVVRIENQETHLDDTNAFLEYIQNVDKVIAYDQSIYDVVYYYENGKTPGVWTRPSSPYELMKEGESNTLFGQTFNIIECPFPLAYEETNVILPLSLKKSLGGSYYIQASDERLIQTVEEVLSRSDYAYSINPLKKNLKGKIKELLYYKEGYVALLVFIFSLISFFAYTLFVMERNAEKLYINRVFGANKYRLFASHLRSRMPVYFACIIASIAVWLFGVNMSACVLALVQFIIIDCFCVYISLCRICRKMEVC